MSKKLTILTALSAYLAQTPGYEGTPTFRGKINITAREAENAFSLLEMPRPAEATSAGFKAIRLVKWPVVIQGWPTDDVQNPSDPAYLMAAAVERHLYKLVDRETPQGLPPTDPNFLLGGLLSDMAMGESVVRPPDAQGGNSRLAMFVLPVVLTFTADYRNP